MGDRPVHNWQSTIRLRVMLIALCLTAWVIGIEARLVYVQIYRYDDYVARAKGQQ